MSAADLYKGEGAAEGGNDSTSGRASDERTVVPAGEVPAVESHSREPYVESEAGDRTDEEEGAPTPVPPPAAPAVKKGSSTASAVRGSSSGARQAASVGSRGAVQPQGSVAATPRRQQGASVAPGGGTAALPVAGGAVMRADPAGGKLKGVAAPVVDPRKYRYDVLRGKARVHAMVVTRDDRMSVEDAAEMLHSIHMKLGLAFETEDVLHTFDSALWFCHTVNGASTLVPGRSKFSVPGVTKEFDYAVIRDMLGPDMRRFFRAYADDITEVNKRVLRDYDYADPIKTEQWGWLTEVAYNRGLQRYPHLAHDSADACLKLSPVERQALRTSKMLVVGATPNSADRMVPRGAVVSADKFDSSVGENY